MKKKTLYIFWGGLFALCAGLGFVPEPGQGLQTVMTVLSLVFFAPPALLIRQAADGKDRNTLILVRNLSALSLAATMLCLVLNLLSALRSQVLGDILHFVLIIVSSPMVCSGYWVLSLFLWACLMMVAAKLTGRK